MSYLYIFGIVRVSFVLYNNKDDVDMFIDVFKNSIELLD